MFVSIYLAAGVCISFYIWMKWRFSYLKRRGIAHEPPLPIVGNMWGWRVTQHTSQIMQRLYLKYKHLGPYVGAYFLMTPIYIITDMELLKRILIKDFTNFDSRGLFYNEQDDPLSAHLFAVDGPKWHSLRPRMTPIFSGAKMKLMFPAVTRTAQELVKVLKERCSGAAASLEVTKLLACYTSDTIGTAIFGLECNGLRDPKAPFVQMGLNAMLKKRYDYIFCLFFPKLSLKLHLKRTPADVEAFYMGLVKDTIKYREEHNIKCNDFVGIMLEMKQKYEAGNTEEGLTLNEIAAQMYVFLVAGFETTATALSLALYELARDEHIQSQLRGEIEEAIAQHGEHGELTYEALQKMKYLEQVISETLRMYPVATEHLRRTNARYEVPGHPHHYLPAGAQLIIPVYSIHHDPEYYPEPEKFQPERFSDEAIQQRPSCAFIPFGQGPRICIGMRFGRIKVAVGLIALLRNFRFSFADETPQRMQFENHSFLLHTKGGFKLRVEELQ
ncbi:probable cytochrome P450 6a23 [Drosophila nasuta]|uniref:probable cytochrome P450 6a23 n=1 Tax=Drosophila nasuta TaxID=42062 RepID=UPI00295EB094|nr:probable cytochrome P450 6a23 [Drosophila nasuta]